MIRLDEALDKVDDRSYDFSIKSSRWSISETLRRWNHGEELDNKWMGNYYFGKYLLNHIASAYCEYPDKERFERKSGKAKEEMGKLKKKDF